ncbi:MAG: acetolactate synthase small subunit [Chitinophagales bacterium]
MKNIYTITAYTENTVGLLSRITAIFTRRHISIQTLNVSETEKKGVFRFTIVVRETEDMVNKVVKQIRKIIEVIHADFHTDNMLVSTQLGLFKIEMIEEQYANNVRMLAAKYAARELARSGNMIVFEKTGNREALEAFLGELSSFGEVEYARSGRVALTVRSIPLREIIPQLPTMNNYEEDYSMEHHEQLEDFVAKINGNH